MLYSENSETLWEFSDIEDNPSILHTFAKNITKYGVVKKSRNIYYYKQYITMDIETSKIKNGLNSKTGKPHYEAFTYSIAVYNGEDCILFRSWQEYNKFFVWLTELLYKSDKYRLVAYVHNLPYEFQFMRNFMEIDHVFAAEPRKVVKCIGNNIEYRCSYKLTNMGLDRFIKSIPPEHIHHYKQSGEDFDYSILRTPRTELKPFELQYIYNDVAGLHEALDYQLESEDDNMATVPLTSTGYVRRHLREVVDTPENHEIFKRIQLDQHLYGLLRDARRGGNCHCSPIHAMKVIEGMNSLDMSSAYPAVMVQKKFPMGKFIPIRNPDEFENYVYDGKFACLIDITFHDIEIKTLATIPYLARSICTQIDNVSCDNGRILKGDNVSIVITDLDYKIIKSQYNFKAECTECICAEYDYLPNELRDELLRMYADKTTLKDKDYYYYMKQKNKFNSTFGCMLTDICQDDISYDQYNPKNPFKKVKLMSYEKKLSKYYNSKNSFLSYQHGIWVTAWCRYRLQRAIDSLGEHLVYCDTDSVKYINSLGNRTLKEKLNEEILQDIKDCGKNCTVEYKGKYYTLGLWEDDGEYATFKSLGAKKYFYTTNDGQIHITVSGLSKAKAEKWFSENGGIKKFTPGTIIPPEWSGRTTSAYNDRIDIIDLQIGDEIVETGSNIVIQDSTYEFGIADEYSELITSIGNGGIL